ncbi:MAG: hypothetical protein ACE5G7_02360 [Candidatus Hydrothermarchaeaceae archaeon]
MLRCRYWLSGEGMLSTKETIMVIWILGIGIGAFLASLLLASERTKDWSGDRITAVSLLTSAIIVSILVLAFYWRT